MLNNRRLIMVLLAVLLLATGLGARVSAQNTAAVKMVDFEFQPKTLTVPVGATVTWTNAGTKKHSATADDGSFDTGLLAPGQSKLVKFDKPGKFQYFCQLHGDKGGVKMSAVIEVTAGGASGEATEAPTAAPTEAVPAAINSDQVVTFSDKAARVDSVTVTLKKFTPLASGHVLAAWLVEGQGKPLSLGAMTIGADGSATVTFNAPKGENLIGTNSRALVTDQPSNDLKTPGALLYSGQVPPKALVHVRHVLFKFPETPKNTGLLLGALDNGKILIDHVALAQKSFDTKDIKAVRLHLEHIYNVAVGVSAGKDLNENGKIDNPGDADGFGVLPYLQRAAEHAKLAADADDASDRIKFYSGTTQAAIQTASDAITQITALAEQGENANDLAGTKPAIDQIAKLANDNIKTGGIAKAYAEALKMAAIDLTAGNGQAQPPAAATTAATESTAATPEATQVQPTQSAANPPAAGAAVTVTMKDFEFVPKEITVAVGTTVTWTNAGTKKHSATADDGSFDTGLFEPGQSKSVKFDKAGTFPYYCQLHGDKGGTAMSGVITVK